MKAQCLKEKCQVYLNLSKNPVVKIKLVQWLILGP
jgi:hypothetical protein